MTRPVFEEGYQKEIGRTGYRVSQLERRPNVGSGAAYQVKVFDDGIPVVVKPDAFVYHIPPWLDGAVLIGVSGSVSVGSATDIEVNIRHAQPACDVTPAGVLATKLLIVGGECYGDNAVVTVDTIVDAGDQLIVDVDQADGDATGLDVAFVFTTEELLSFVVRGSQGQPGGIVAWSGVWTGNSPPAEGAWVTATGYTLGDIVESGGTFYVATANHTSGALTEPGVGANWATVWEVVEYVENQAVTNGGSSYVALVDHTATAVSEPGVGVDWEDYWMLLAGGEQLKTSELEMAVFGRGYQIDVGHKDRIRVPFDCTIVEASIFADRAGDLVVDIWKSTYAGYPPDDTDSITGGNEPTLAAQIKTTDTALTGWTTAIAAGEVLVFMVDSCSVITQFTLSLIVERV